MKFLPVFLLLIVSCSPGPKNTTLLQGLISNSGGEIRFTFGIPPDSSRGVAYVLNGPDTLWYNRSIKTADSISYYFDALDSRIAVSRASQHGWYEKRASRGRRIRMPLHLSSVPEDSAVKTKNHRFDGEWQVVFHETSGPSPATGIFALENGQLKGTFVTETGDFRFLTGIAGDDGFSLWTFDIAHAYFFGAQLVDENTLSGQFWAYNDSPVPWTAKRGTNMLRDPMQVTKLKPDARIQFSFQNEFGQRISNTDPAFAGKPMLVYIFGSWCPNCADEARLIEQLSLQYAETELQIVGLAFEYSGNPAEDIELVKLYRKRFGVTWNTLLAGSSDKTEASAKLPFIEKVVSFPTSFFVRRDGSIEAVHTGFSGPGTGAYHTLEKQRFIEHINAILR